ncbi:MAG: type II secretion system protein, partial [Planctomycetota bacterium]
MNHACRQPRRHSTSGFTLVEMLIAVTLVLLMMLLFA